MQYVYFGGGFGIINGDFQLWQRDKKLKWLDEQEKMGSQKLSNRLMTETSVHAMMASWISEPFQCDIYLDASIVPSYAVTA